MIRSFLSGSRRHNNQSSRSTTTTASAVSREPIHSRSSTEGAFPTADTPLTPKRQQKDEATSSTRNKKKMSLRSKNQTKKKKKKDKKQLEKEPKSPGNNEKRLSPLSLSARRSRKGYRKQPENSESGAFPSLSTSSATTSSSSNRSKKKKTREESKRRGRRARKADKKKPSDASVPNNNTSQQAPLQNAPTHRVTPAYPAVPPKPATVKTTPPSPPKLEELPTTPTASLSSSWKNELERTGMYGNQGLQFHPPPYPAKGGDVSSSEDEGAEDLRGLGTNGTILEEDSEACYTSQDEDDDASERDVSLASFSESEYSVTTDNDEDDDDSDTRSLNSSASSALNKYGLIRILDDSESEDEGSAVFVNPRSFDDEEKKEDDLNASLEEELGSVSSRRSRKRILRRHRSRSRSQTRRQRGDEDKDATQPLLNEAPSSPSRDMNTSLLRQFSDDTSSASSLDEAVHRFHDGSFPKQPMGRTSIETASSTQETLSGSSNTNIFPTQWLARTIDWMQPSTKGVAKQETKPAPIQVAHDEEQPLLKRSEDSPDAAWRPYDFSMIAPPMSSSSSPPSLKQVSSPVEIFQATSQEQESEVEAPRIKVDKALPQGVRLPDAALAPISPKHLSPKDRDAVLPSFQQPPNQSSPETTATAKSLVVGAMVSSTHTTATESTKRSRRHSRSFSGKRNRQRWLDAMQELSRNEWTTSSTALALGVTPMILLGVFGNAIAASATASGILVLCTGSLLNLVCCMAIAWRLNVRRRNDTEQEQRLLQKQDKWRRRLERKQAQQTDLQSQLLALQAKKRLLERRTQLLQQMQDNNIEIKRRQHEQVVWSTLQILMQHYDQSPTNKRHSPKRSRASWGTSDNASLGSTAGNSSVQSATSGHISMQSLPARHFTFGNNPSNNSPNNSKRRNRVVSVTPPHLGGQHVHELALDWLAQRWQKIPGVTLKEDSNKDKTKKWNQQKLTVAELLRSTETAVQYKPPRLNNQHGPQDI